MSTRRLADRAGHLPANYGRRLLKLADWRMERSAGPGPGRFALGKLFYRRMSFQESLGLFPQSQVVKNFFNASRWSMKAADAHLSLAFGRGRGVRLIKSSDD